MKKTILLSSILAVGAALADANDVAVTSTELGVMGVAKPTSQYGLIAVPFSGYNGSDINVADMINTAEFTAGTKLYVPNANGEYSVWQLKEDKTWEPADSVTVDTVANLQPGSDASGATADLGGAFWLEPAEGSAATTFYLLGQPTENGSSTAVAGKWNLIGNTSGSEVSLKDLKGTTGDQIVVPLENGKLRYYTYKAEKGWRYQTKTGAWSVPADEPLTVGVGKGIWCKPASNLTIDWNPVQAQ